MPYISTFSRNRYNPLIEEVIHVILDGSESKLVKGEYFGFLVNKVIKGYMNSADKNNPTFNSSLFNPLKHKKLVELSEKFLVFLNQDEPLESSGELNYCLSAVYWGLQGSMEGVEKASYGFRTYLRGTLEQVRSGLPSSPFSTSGEQKERLKAGRKYVVVLGVINDVISECYRMVTAKYENGKMSEHGGLWVNNRLVYEDASSD